MIMDKRNDTGNFSWDLYLMARELTCAFMNSCHYCCPVQKATFALLEEGKPKQWNPRLTGGRPVALRVPRQCADSGEIKVRSTYRCSGSRSIVIAFGRTTKFGVWDGLRVREG